MPKSKRNKVVSLTKTAAKGKDLKTNLIESLRNSIDEYKRVYLFSYENMRASIFKDIRMDWRESRIYLGKNTICQIAFGKSVEDEFKDNLHHISKNLEGNVGILFTSRPHQEVLDYFSSYEKADFAKSGYVAEDDIILDIGPLPFQTSMLDQLRKLGLIVEVKDSQVILQNKFTAATAGEPLTPEQAKVLVHLNRKIITFSIKLLSHWEDGQYQELI